jgi:hypothetical protein
LKTKYAEFQAEFIDTFVSPAKNVFTASFQAGNMFSASWTNPAQTAESTILSHCLYENEYIFTAARDCLAELIFRLFS